MTTDPVVPLRSTALSVLKPRVTTMRRTELMALLRRALRDLKAA